jgi:hypothetical protein
LGKLIFIWYWESYFWYKNRFFNLEGSEFTNRSCLGKDYFKFSGISGNEKLEIDKQFKYQLDSPTRWQSFNRNIMAKDNLLNLYKYIYFKKKRNRYEDEEVMGRKLFGYTNFKEKRKWSAVIGKLIIDLNNREILWKHQKYFKAHFNLWKHQKYSKAHFSCNLNLQCVLQKISKHLYPYRLKNDQHLLREMIKSSGSSLLTYSHHFYPKMEEQFPIILDNLLLKLESFYLKHVDPILSRSYLPPTKTTVRNRLEYNFF